MLKLVSVDHSDSDSNAGNSGGNCNDLGTVSASASASASMAGHAEAAETSEDGHQTTYSIVESLSTSNVSKHRLTEHKDIHRLKLPSRFIPSGFDFDRRQRGPGISRGSSFFCRIIMSWGGWISLHVIVQNA